MRTTASKLLFSLRLTIVRASGFIATDVKDSRLDTGMHDKVVDPTPRLRIDMELFCWVKPDQQCQLHHVSPALRLAFIPLPPSSSSPCFSTMVGASHVMSIRNCTARANEAWGFRPR